MLSFSYISFLTFYQIPRPTKIKNTYNPLTLTLLFQDIYLWQDIYHKTTETACEAETTFNFEGTNLGFRCHPPLADLWADLAQYLV